MKPLSLKEARLLASLERGFGWRLLAGPVVGALGGLVFAWVMMRGVSSMEQFHLRDTQPAYARLEAAVGPHLAFFLLCAGAFAGLGIFVMILAVARLGRLRSQLRYRRDEAGVEGKGVREPAIR